MAYRPSTAVRFRRVACGVAVLLVAVVTSAVVHTDPVAAGDPFVIRHGLTASEFHLAVDDLGADGYRPSRIEVVASEAGAALFSAIWESWQATDPAQAWTVREGLTGPELIREAAALRRQGLYVVSVAAYEVDGQARFAAVWHVDPDVVYMGRLGMSARQLQRAVDTFAVRPCRRGDLAPVASSFAEATSVPGRVPRPSPLKLIDVDGYLDGGVVRYVAIWYLEGGDYVGRHGMSTYDFHWEDHGTSLQPVRVGVDPDGQGGVSHTKVWHATPSPRHYVFVDRTHDDHRALVEEKSSQGYAPIDIAASVDPEDGLVTYTSLWIAPVGSTMLQLGIPVRGLPNVDWVVVNYQDHDPSPGVVLDHQGGTWLYDQHNGLDLTLRNFEQMDAGVPVYAAEDGVVVARDDGHFDRNTCGIEHGVCDEPMSNFVLVQHGNGQRTWYSHLRKDSVLVEVGDDVRRGQQIAEVGSSGNSSDPHLHFAVLEPPYDTGVGGDDLIDPFEGPFGNSQNLWMTGFALPYAATTLNLLDSDVADHWPDRLEHTERVPAVRSFQGPFAQDDVVVFWLQWNGCATGERALVVRLIRPSGGEHASITPDEMCPRYTFSSWGFYLSPLAAVETGEWRWVVEVGGQSVLEAPFTITS